MLMDLDFKSVGREACLDLLILQNRKGLLYDKDIGELLKRTFENNLVKTAAISATNVQGKNEKLFCTQKLADNDRYGYRAMDNAVTKTSLVPSWKHSQTFNIIRLRENIKLG